MEGEGTTMTRSQSGGIGSFSPTATAMPKVSCQEMRGARASLWESFDVGAEDGA